MISDGGTPVNEQLSAFRFYMNLYVRFGGIVGCLWNGGLSDSLEGTLSLAKSKIVFR